MKLQRIVGRYGYVETATEKLRQGIAMNIQEKKVITQRRHGDADLGEIIEVLHSRCLANSI